MKAVGPFLLRSLGVKGRHGDPLARPVNLGQVFPIHKFPVHRGLWESAPTAGPLIPFPGSLPSPSLGHYTPCLTIVHIRGSVVNKVGGAQHPSEGQTYLSC